LVLSTKSECPPIGQLTAAKQTQSSEVKSGGTNLDRRDSWDLLSGPIEKGKSPLPVHGFHSARRGRGGKTSRRKKGRRSVPNLPPRLELVMTVDLRLRFQSNNSTSAVSLTRRSLCACLGGIVTVANTTVTMLFTTYRLQSVICWPSSNSSVLIDVPPTQSGAEQALNKESTKNAAIPAGMTVDEAVVWKPKRGTMMGMWQAVGNDPTDQLLAISCESGAVFDFHIQATLGGSTSSQSTYTTTSTLALGTMVRAYPDLSNRLTPVGYTAASW